MVSAVSFRSFRFDVSPFSTCRCKVVTEIVDFTSETVIQGRTQRGGGGGGSRGSCPPKEN